MTDLINVSLSFINNQFLIAISLWKQRERSAAGTLESGNAFTINGGSMNKFALSAASAALILSMGLAGEYAQLPVSSLALAQTAPSASTLSAPALEALVAPLALYPDSLVSQMLMASTYPLEIAEATSWLHDHATIKGEALKAALAPEKWDNSVKSLVAFPAALNALGEKLDWTQSLGEAYLAQPKQVMAAIQSLRVKAQQAGHLKTSEQMTVSADPQSNIVIAPVNPEVIYVPQYNPTVVYGAWPYAAYPPAPAYGYGYGAPYAPAPGYSGGAMAAVGMMSFGMGMAVGGSLWSSPNWNQGSININNNSFNNFNNSNNNINNRSNNFSNNGNWNYNSAHNGGVPFNNTNLQNKYGTPGNQTAAQQAAERSAIQHGTAEAKTDASNAYNKMSPANQSRVNNAESQAKSNYNNYESHNAANAEEKPGSKESSEGLGGTRNEAAQPKGYGAYSADHGEEKANSKESSEGMGATRNEAGERRTSAERQEGAQRREERREPRREGAERKEGSERR